MKPWFFESSLEETIRKEMQGRGLRLGIDFVVQYPLKFSFILDFAFPDFKLAIEVDGVYWHSQKKNRKRDKVKDSILAREGWKVLRIPEQQVMQNPSGCVDYILDELQNMREGQSF